MPQTVEVRFKGIRRDFFLWPDDREPLRPREAVVVQVERGQDLGRVASTDGTAEKKCGGCTGCSTGGQSDDSAVRRLDGSTSAERPDGEVNPGDGENENTDPTSGPTNRPADEPTAEPPNRPTTEPAELRPVLRRASPEEIRTADTLRRSEEDARRQAIEKARQHRLDMKVSDAEWQWDRGKLTLYFTAEKRVDFRGLVRDLAAAFRTRIELRQIGVRDEAARLSGVGRCGREYCCSSWLKELSPVSLALAKDQHLSLNPAQISGGCGRLLCCLKYEHEFYVAARKRFPREGKTVTAGRGTEKVIAVDIFRERVFLRNEEGPRIIPLVQLREEEGEAVRRLGGSAAREEGSAVGRSGGSKGEDRTPGHGPTKPVAHSPQPTNRPTAEPPNTTDEPTNTTDEPTNRPTAQPPKKRRRRRGRRGGRGPQGGPPAPPGPPEG